jgi:hypothetical protein
VTRAQKHRWNDVSNTGGGVSNTDGVVRSVQTEMGDRVHGKGNDGMVRASTTQISDEGISNADGCQQHRWSGEDSNTDGVVRTATQMERTTRIER